jgi:N-acetylglucosamine-6-sulfatase
VQAIIRRRSLGLLAGSLACGLLVLQFGGLGARGPELALSRPPLAAKPRPNVVLVQLDDARLDDISAQTMPFTWKLLAHGGTSFRDYYVTTPVCCPSRTSLLTGRYAHNHRVLTNSPHLAGGGGGFPAFERHVHGDYLAPWLQAAGYRTIHIGKFLNFYGRGNPRVVPPGWSGWATLLDNPSESRYYDYRLNIDGQVSRPIVRRKRSGGRRCLQTTSCTYVTDRLTLIAQRELRRNRSRPIYLQLDEIAPHGDLIPPDGPAVKRSDRRRLQITKRPGGTAFNETDVSDKPRFLRSQPPLNRQEIQHVRRAERLRRLSLGAVDRGLRRIASQLSRQGRLQNTYILLTSDNGLLLGEHRFRTAKFLAYEPVTHMPLLIRGPGIPRGRLITGPAANIDLAPTILRLLGGPLDHRFDGISLASALRGGRLPRRRALLLEAYPPGRPRKAYVPKPKISNKAPSRRYSGILLGHWKLIDYGQAGRELYDLRSDPNETRSLARNPRYRNLVRALELRLGRLRACRGTSCSRPFRSSLPSP